MPPAPPSGLAGVQSTRLTSAKAIKTTGSATSGKSTVITLAMPIINRLRLRFRESQPRTALVASSGGELTFTEVTRSAA